MFLTKYLYYIIMHLKIQPYEIMVNYCKLSFTTITPYFTNIVKRTLPLFTTVFCGYFPCEVITISSLCILSVQLAIMTITILLFHEKLLKHSSFQNLETFLKSSFLGTACIVIYITASLNYII